MRRRPSFVLSVLMLLPLLSFPACDTAEGRSGRVRVELWTLALRPRFDEYMTDLVARFEQQNPTIDVVWVDVPFDAMQRKFLASAAAGRAPDVVNLSDGFYARFVSLGGLIDLSSEFEGDPTQVYFDGALRVGRIDDKLYALPWYLAANIGFLNTRLLADAGIDPASLPNDWPGLRRAAKSYFERTGKHLMAPQLGHESQLPLWIIADNLAPLRRTADGTIESNLDDPRIVRLVQEWVDLYRSGALPAESAVGDHGSMIDLYQRGRTAFMVTGPNFLQRIHDASPDVFANTLNRPSPVGADGQHEISTMLLCVTAQSKHPRQATRLAQFITSAENQLAFAKIVSILPSTPESLLDPHFRQTATKLDQSRAISAASMRNATSHIPALAAWPELTSVFEERIKSALLDGADVGATLNMIGREWNGILAGMLAPGPFGSDDVADAAHSRSISRDAPR